MYLYVFIVRSTFLNIGLVTQTTLAEVMFESKAPIIYLRNFLGMGRHLLNLVNPLLSVVLLGWVLELESCCSMSWLRSQVIFHSSSNSHFLDCRSTEAAIKHYQIKKNDSGQWYVTERHVFQSIPELIWYHQHNAAGKWGTSNWVSQGARPLMGNASLVSGTQQEQISL